MKKKTILVTGLHGYIGSRFVQQAASNFYLIGYQGNIIGNKPVDQEINKRYIDAVLHLAGKTHIDRCEKDKKFGKNGETWQVNVIGTENIVKACEAYGKYLLMLSTECVFDGIKGKYTENDTTHPKNWYGVTKSYGEEKIIMSKARYSILRSVLAYGHTDNHPGDIFDSIRSQLMFKKSVKFVNDQFANFTFIDDLVKVIIRLLKEEKKGIYHFAGDTIMSPYELAVKINNFYKIKRNDIRPVTMREYFGNKYILRLKNATLSCKKIKKDFNIGLSNFNNAMFLIKNK